MLTPRIHYKQCSRKLEPQKASPVWAKCHLRNKGMASSGGERLCIFQCLMEVTGEWTDQSTSLICQTALKLTVPVPTIKILLCYADASVTAHPKLQSSAITWKPLLPPVHGIHAFVTRVVFHTRWAQEKSWLDSWDCWTASQQAWALNKKRNNGGKQPVLWA